MQNDNDVMGPPGPDQDEATQRNSNVIAVRHTDPLTGRFAKGNPGKPKGARNKATLMAQEMLQSEADGLVQRAVQLAMAGNAGIMKLCMDRLVPLRRERTVEFEVGLLETAKDAVLAAGRVTQLVAGGELTPSEGQALSSIIENQRRAIETAELERRLLILEASVK
jgi:hypothetical protein